MKTLDQRLKCRW